MFWGILTIDQDGPLYKNVDIDFGTIQSFLLCEKRGVPPIKIPLNYTV